jgi:hypothetical protein
LDTNCSPTGVGSVNIVAVAVFGPLLVTTMVNVTF